MIELLVALRNAIIAIILAMIGVTFSDATDDSEPVEEPTSSLPTQG